MKSLYKFFSISLVSSLLLCACIQDEPLNMEADILEVNVPDLPENIRFGTERIKPDKGTNQIEILIKANGKVGELSPEFILTEGATISPASGTTLDFSGFNGQKYTVTSENRKWTKEYTVRVVPPYIMTADNGGNGKTKSFGFNHYQKFDGDYNFHEFYEEAASGRKDFIWGSGNLGFALTNKNTQAENYPTFAIAEGKSGSAACLVTRSTGLFGAMVGMPIATGNLFLGSFDVSQAIKTPLLATQFGVPYMMNEPVEVQFLYKFQGGTFKDKNGVEQQDYPSIYAVLFEPEVTGDGEIILLNGENVRTASNIISIAELDTAQIIRSKDIATAEFTQCSIQFVLRKAFDAQKLANGNYYITIVFASSCRGEYFEGFVGNTLIVDEVILITK
ncbi:MAG: PCMD domain-containing protein [Bacteroidetes bacterium]|nr:PCMD domain-containing protein [Bacteroidota bacterium]